MKNGNIRVNLKWLTCAFVFVGLFVMPVRAAVTGLVHYVSSSGSHTFPYTNWSTAATDIQSAIDVAENGGMVLVTNGLYDSGSTKTPDSDSMNRICITNAIIVQSVNGSDVTFIAGQAAGVGTNQREAVRGAFMANGAVLVGFTITNGHTAADGGGVLCSGTATLSNCVLSGNTATGNGGGVSGGRLKNCRLAGNVAEHDGGGAEYAELDNCSLSGNTAQTGGGTFGGRLTNCVLTGNGAFVGGGAQYATFFNCTLTSNTASLGGGANTCTLTSCLLSGNSATNYGGGVQYGNLYNCLLVGNSANRGGGVAGGYEVRNCTLTDNAASIDGGGTYDVGAINCIIWGNHCTNNNNRANYANGYPVYSCTSPMPMPVPYPTGSNIVADPLFVDPVNGDYRLQIGSPCCNMGNNAYAPTNISPEDLVGNTRILNGRVDMGACELFQPFEVGKSGELIVYPDRYEIRYVLSFANDIGTNASIFVRDPLPADVEFSGFESSNPGWRVYLANGSLESLVEYDIAAPTHSGEVYTATFLVEVLRNPASMAITNTLTMSITMGDVVGVLQAVSVVYLPDRDRDAISDLDDPDDDNDGMADYWETYYGLNPFSFADADDDPDGDGRNNLVEFGDHTDPFVADTPVDGQYCLVDNRDPNCSDLTGFPFRTIQAAMDAVMPNETIEVADGVYTGNYFLARDLDLRGATASFIENASTTSVFNIPDGICASISGFTFEGITNEVPPVMINAGHVVLSNIVVSGCLNKAEYYHGGSGGSFIRGGKGMLRNEAGATMRVYRSLFDGNFACGYALYNTTAYGGAICNYGQLRIFESTFSSNLCDSGWNYHVPLPSYGGAIYNSGTTEIDACTFSGNRVLGGSCSRQPVGLSGYGGAICNDGFLSVTRSTLSGNSAAAPFSAPGVGGAIYVSAVASAEIDSCTIVYNEGDMGGGISATSNVVIRNTIFSGNGAEFGPDAHGRLISAGYNLLGDSSDVVISGDASTMLLDVDPLIASLADNGGPSWSCALRVGSPAIDAGHCGGMGTNVGMTADQRGIPRPLDWTNVPNAGDGCDIGAYEFDNRDDDGDGMWNDWECQYGLNPGEGSDAAADLDGDGLAACSEFELQTDPTCGDSDADGMSDGHEILAGMDPLDAESVFKTDAAVQEGAGSRITWSSASGKVYRIVRSFNLAEGFHDVIAEGIPATPPQNTFIDTTAQGENACFYRIVVE